MQKTAIITGGNAGLGLECAKNLARSNQGWHIILACRNKVISEQSIKQFKEGCKNDKFSFTMEFQSLDLGSLASVREFASEFKKKSPSIPPLKTLICNAGRKGT